MYYTQPYCNKAMDMVVGAVVVVPYHTSGTTIPQKVEMDTHSFYPLRKGIQIWKREQPTLVKSTYYVYA
jgi:hypothetical protein